MLKSKKDIELYLKEVEHRNTIEQNEKLFSLIKDLKRRVQEAIDNEKYNYVIIKETKKYFFFISTTVEQPAVLVMVSVLNDGIREGLSSDFYNVIITEINKMFQDHTIIKFDVSKNMSSLIFSFFLRPNT